MFLQLGKLIPLYFILCFLFFIFFNPNDSKGASDSKGEYYSHAKRPDCSFKIENSNAIDKCYINKVYKLDPSNPNIYTNKTVVKVALNNSINFNNLNEYKISKSLVRSESIPMKNYSNVGEPSFASNGTIIFYAGNHYAARSTDGKNWHYVNPSFDFRGDEVDLHEQPTGKIIDLFWADQRVVYDENHQIFIWIRQGEIIREGQSLVTDIDRIAVSKDTINWTVYDLRPRDIFKDFGIRDAAFDYPEVIVNDKYLYFTSSVADFFTGKTYGAIIRFSLNDLGNHTTVNFDAKLDREVISITPVDGTSNPVYLGTHLPNDTSKMKIYSWTDNSNFTHEKIVNINPWNDIHNAEYCNTESKLWWCQAHTSSKIRNAWLFNNTISFLWNAVITYDNGKTWQPFIDAATFDLNNNMTYTRKYYLSNDSIPWVFGAATPDDNNRLGLIAYYITNNNTNPYLNLAFGVFNHTNNKWDLDEVIWSNLHLPVIDKNNKANYDWGDFLTIRKHVPSSSSNNNYSWDAGGYALIGEHYFDIAPYFFKIR